ncbi:MAG: exonuclease domain-containing protein [Micrococcales bacterium]
MTDELFSALPAYAKRIAVFDTETTGLDLKTARIVTATVVELDEFGAVVVDRDEWLADPGIEIPEVAANVHGITTAIAREKGRDYREVVSEILEVLRDCFSRGIPVVAYNAPYDFTILYHQAIALGLEPITDPMPVIDPLVIDKQVDRYRKGPRRLEVSAEFYKVKLDDAHNSKADAIAAGRVGQAVIAKFATALPDNIVDLHNEQSIWADEQEKSFSEFLSKQGKNAKPSFGWPLKLGAEQKIRGQV